MRTSTVIAPAVLAMAALAGAGSAAAGEIEAPGPQGALHGTLLPPAKGGPLLLIIPGSGPTDRDGNNPAGVRAASYRLLAEALAARGIGSVRIDKRGMFASAGAVADPNAVTIAAYADDVRSWVAAIRAKTGAACVWLAGHSEGGLVALAAAQPAGGRGAEGLCGVILMSTAGRPLGVVMREQLKANPANAPVLDQALDALDRLEKRESVDVSALHPALQALFAPQVQPYFMDILVRDPAPLAARIALPMLIVQGDRDLQISLADAEALHGAQPNARLVILPGVTHALKLVASDDRAANMATYADPALPIAPDVVAAIADFVTSHSGRKEPR
ncbi:MAG: alpha/beta hydrolase [Sphingobium sp. 66-54]|nr:MAG: alpha/beta hydrolase [Sphingobium sp. 66-54]